jgi:glycosyltransferase involved in cell wall biosynthesis
MRRQVFIEIGGFDAVNTPIMHSDVDLSFKVREAGLRCVYTPHATLLHIGHQSLSEFDKKQTKNSQDKADIYLMKRWGEYLSYDPYFTDNMRGLLYHDSPESIGMVGKNRSDFVNNHPDVLIVTHDMSASGAPMVAYKAAKHLLLAGAFPVVASPEDGPMRALFDVLGVPVIIDSLLLTRHDSITKLARNFDCVLANTVASWPIVYQLLDLPTPVMWYLHESHLISDLAEENTTVVETLRAAKNVYAGSERAASFCRPFNKSVKILTYGVPDIYNGEGISEALKEPMVFSVFGSIEPRKGQDVFLEAIRLVGNRAEGKAIFNVIGRTLDKGLALKLREMAEGLENVFFHGSVEHDQYLKLVGKSHVVVCPSRDDTLPLVTLDALSLGKTLICTNTTGTSSFMTDGKDGLVVPSSDPEALAEAILKLIEAPMSLVSMGAESRQTFLRNFSVEKFSKCLVGEIRSLSRRGL